MVPRCCLCNGLQAKCVRCVCARGGRPCVSCRPSDARKCCNASNRRASPRSPVAVTGSSRRPSFGPSPLSLPSSVPAAQQGSAADPSVVQRRQQLSGNEPGSPSSPPPPALPGNEGDEQASAPQPPAPQLTDATTPLPSLNSIFQAKLPTLRHVPKGARSEWARVVSGVSAGITSQPMNVTKWKLFFMLPRCILANPARGGRSHWREVLETVRCRIRRWRQGAFSELWAEVEEEESRLSRRRKPRIVSEESLRASNVRRAKRAVEEGQYKKALQALRSEGLAKPNQDVYKEMLLKHPQGPAPFIPQMPAAPPPIIKADVVLKCIRSFPAGSAPGPSHLRAAHLKEAVLCPSTDQANQTTRALTQLVELLCSGLIPNEVVPYLCGASLLASQKKGGGLRPIAVGEVLRRLVSKTLSTTLRQEAINSLSPHQKGVGVKAGCESIIHTITQFREVTPPSNNWALMVDFKNAFNSIDRSSMFNEIRTRMPSLSLWMECCYGGHPLLHLGDYKIPSCSGVQQGDPLGPLGFALALHPIIEEINNKVPTLNINGWYLDDGILVGAPTDICKALEVIEQEGPPRGLFLNRQKSLLISPVSDSPPPSCLPQDIPVTKSDFCLLGCPIGSTSFCNSTLLKKVEKVKECLSKLPDLQDSQMEATLLRHCLSFPKISFSIRTCPPALIQEALGSFDDLIRETLTEIAGGPLPEWTWRKASLPIHFGGLGLRNASTTAPAAYIGSTSEAKASIEVLCGLSTQPPHLDHALKELSKEANRPDWASIEDIDVPLRQQTLSRSCDRNAFESLLNSAPDPRSKALALGTSLPRAGDWLKVIPSTTLGLHMSDDEFRPCLQYWLGMRMIGENSTCPVCQKSADAYGDHQVGCGGNGDRISRHNAISDVVFSAAQSAALCPRKEVPSLIPNSSSRPADIYLPNWERGQPAALDVTVISPLQQLTLARASSEAGYALQVAEERKKATHAEACRSAGVIFHPLAMETLGGWSQEMLVTVNRISRLQAQRLNRSRGDSFRHLAQRLSVTLWRGNAWMWTSRLPVVPAHVDGSV